MTPDRLASALNASKRRTILSTPANLGERATRVYASSHPSLAIMTAPLRDLMSSSSSQKVMAVAAGAVSVIVDQAFITLFPIAVLASLTDYVVGRYRARREVDAMGRPRFEPVVAQIGYSLKVTTYTQLVIIWMGELWAASHLPGLLARLGLGLPEWAAGLLSLLEGGWISTALLMGYLVTEIDSIEAHKIAMGKGPLWGWDILSRVLRRVMAKVANALGDTPPDGGGGSPAPIPPEQQERDRQRVLEEDAARRRPPPSANGRTRVNGGDT